MEIDWPKDKDGNRVSVERLIGAYIGESDELRARLAEVEAQSVHVYNSGYHAGHHDTVEGRYVDIHPSDMDSYHAEEVEELREALAKLEAHDGK